MQIEIVLKTDQSDLRINQDKNMWVHLKNMNKEDVYLSITIGEVTRHSNGGSVTMNLKDIVLKEDRLKVKIDEKNMDEKELLSQLNACYPYVSDGDEDEESYIRQQAFDKRYGSFLSAIDTIGFELMDLFGNSLPSSNLMESTATIMPSEPGGSINDEYVVGEVKTSV